jgi:hypothetical protein
MRCFFRSVILAGIVLALPLAAFAQAPTVVSFTAPQIPPVATLNLIPISATAAVNTQTTLTIPAPPGGQYNYVCWLAFEINQDATGTVYTNAVSTSTNFFSFAVKVSQAATVNIDSGVNLVLGGMAPATGCTKSASPGIATTFVGPVANLHAAWTWYATYYQAP